MLRSAGRWAYRQWMRFAHVLAVVNTAILLTIIYVLVIGPAALVLWMIRKDLLDRTLRREGSYWRMREPVRHAMEDVRRQF